MIRLAILLVIKIILASMSSLSSNIRRVPHVGPTSRVVCIRTGVGHLKAEEEVIVERARRLSRVKQVGEEPLPMRYAVRLTLPLTSHEPALLALVTRRRKAVASRLGADVQALDAPIAIINELLKDAQELGEHDDEGEALDVAEALADVALALEQAAASSVGLQQLTYLRSQASCRDIGSGSVPEGCLSSQRPRGRFLAFGGHQ